MPTPNQYAGTNISTTDVSLGAIRDEVGLTGQVSFNDQEVRTILNPDWAYADLTPAGLPSPYDDPTGINTTTFTPLSMGEFRNANDRQPTYELVEISGFVSGYPGKAYEGDTITYELRIWDFGGGTGDGTLYWHFNGDTFDATAISGQLDITGSHAYSSIQFSIDLIQDITVFHDAPFTVSIRASSDPASLSLISLPLQIVDITTSVTVNGNSAITLTETNSPTTVVVTLFNHGPYPDGYDSVFWTIAGGVSGGLQTDYSTEDFAAISGEFDLTVNLALPNRYGTRYEHAIGEFELEANRDWVTEGAESYTLQIRSASTTGPIIGTQTINISDTSLYRTYNFSVADVEEDSDVILSVADSGDGFYSPGESVTWTLTQPTGESRVVTTSGTATISAAGTIVLSDTTKENIYNGPIAISWEVVTLGGTYSGTFNLNDQPTVYNIAVSGNNLIVINGVIYADEGTELTFLVTGNNVPSGTVYLDIIHDTTVNLDFEPTGPAGSGLYKPIPVTITAAESGTLGQGSITIDTDSLTGHFDQVYENFSVVLCETTSGQYGTIIPNTTKLFEINTGLVTSYAFSSSSVTVEEANAITNTLEVTNGVGETVSWAVTSAYQHVLDRVTTSGSWANVTTNQSFSSATTEDTTVNSPLGTGTVTATGSVTGATASFTFTLTEINPSYSISNVSAVEGTSTGLQFTITANRFAASSAGYEETEIEIRDQYGLAPTSDQRLEYTSATIPVVYWNNAGNVADIVIATNFGDWADVQGSTNFYIWVNGTRGGVVTADFTMVDAAPTGALTGPSTISENAPVDLRKELADMWRTKPYANVRNDLCADVWPNTSSGTDYSMQFHTWTTTENLSNLNRPGPIGVSAATYAVSPADRTHADKAAAQQTLWVTIIYRNLHGDDTTHAANHLPYLTINGTNYATGDLAIPGGIRGTGNIVPKFGYTSVEIPYSNLASLSGYFTNGGYDNVLSGREFWIIPGKYTVSIAGSGQSTSASHAITVEEHDFVLAFSQNGNDGDIAAGQSVVNTGTASKIMGVTQHWYDAQYYSMWVQTSNGTMTISHSGAGADDCTHSLLIRYEDNDPIGGNSSRFGEYTAPAPETPSTSPSDNTTPAADPDDDLIDWRTQQN